MSLSAETHGAIAARVFEKRQRAHAKHGANSIEAKDASDTVFWLGCLGEEMGEVFSTFTYDKAPETEAELYDVASVVFAWIAAFERQREAG